MLRNSDPLLTEKEAALYLNISPYWLQKQRCLGTGPLYVVIGSRAIRYRLSDLEAYVNRTTSGSKR